MPTASKPNQDSAVVVGALFTQERWNVGQSSGKRIDAQLFPCLLRNFMKGDFRHSPQARRHLPSTMTRIPPARRIEADGREPECGRRDARATLLQLAISSASVFQNRSAETV